jgi:ribonuclease PH
MTRHDGRRFDELRQVHILAGYQEYAEGSVLIRCGSTKVICSASVDEHVPGWLRGQGRGWITAEYALMPRSTQSRTRRERNGPGGRTQEIQRLIGRSLRAAVDLQVLGERMVTVDCDVLQADGGTRTAAITGGYVALALALRGLYATGRIAHNPLLRAVAAVSVGLRGTDVLLDLDYPEDSTVDMDCNVVMTDAGEFVEVQGTAEGEPVGRERFNELLDLAARGIAQLIEAQHQVLDG